MSFSIIAAISSNSGIGRENGDLLFHIKGDLQRFKSITENSLCVMGRKTYESIIKMNGKPLPSRTTVVLTRDESYKTFDGVHVFNSVEKIINHNKTSKAKDKKVFVCGGAEIYDLFLPYASEIFLTHVNKHVEADVYYSINKQEELGFYPIEESEEFYSEKYDAYYKFVRYIKKEGM